MSGNKFTQPMEPFPMKNARRLAALMFVPTAFAALVIPTAAHADTQVPVESATPKVDSVVNSAEAAAEKAPATAPVASLESLKARAAEQIAKRQKTLIDWTADVAKAKGDCGQNAGSTARISQTQAGLTALGAQIQAATDLAAAKVLYGQIFTSYRVYLVVGPSVHVSLACGAQSARSARLLTEVANVQALIATAAAGGANTAPATALLGQVQPLVDQAKTGASVASNAVASIVPDLGNEATKNANAATVVAARDQIKAADAQLDAAAKALRDARASFSGAKKTERAEDKADKKAEKKAEHAAKKAEQKSKHEAEKAVKQAERETAKATREAAKAERKSKK
jgi:hypothetical protein